MKTLGLCLPKDRSKGMAPCPVTPTSTSSVDRTETEEDDSQTMSTDKDLLTEGVMLNESRESCKISDHSTKIFNPRSDNRLYNGLLNIHQSTKDLILPSAKLKPQETTNTESTYLLNVSQSVVGESGERRVSGTSQNIPKSLSPRSAKCSKRPSLEFLVARLHDRLGLEETRPSALVSLDGDSSKSISCTTDSDNVNIHSKSTSSSYHLGKNNDVLTSDFVNNDSIAKNTVEGSPSKHRFDRNISETKSCSDESQNVACDSRGSTIFAQRFSPDVKCKEYRHVETSFISPHLDTSLIHSSDPDYEISHPSISQLQEKINDKDSEDSAIDTQLNSNISNFTETELIPPILSKAEKLVTKNVTESNFTDFSDSTRDFAISCTSPSHNSDTTEHKEDHGLSKEGSSDTKHNKLKPSVENATILQTTYTEGANKSPSVLPEEESGKSPENSIEVIDISSDEVSSVKDVIEHFNKKQKDSDNLSEKLVLSTSTTPMFSDTPSDNSQSEMMVKISDAVAALLKNTSHNKSDDTEECRKDSPDDSDKLFSNSNSPTNSASDDINFTSAFKILDLLPESTDSNEDKTAPVSQEVDTRETIQQGLESNDSDNSNSLPPELPSLLEKPCVEQLSSHSISQSLSTDIVDNSEECTISPITIADELGNSSIEDSTNIEPKSCCEESSATLELEGEVKASFTTNPLVEKLDENNEKGQESSCSFNSNNCDSVDICPLTMENELNVNVSSVIKDNKLNVSDSENKETEAAFSSPSMLTLPEILTERYINNVLNQTCNYFCSQLKDNISNFRLPDVEPQSNKCSNTPCSKSNSCTLPDKCKLISDFTKENIGNEESICQSENCENQCPAEILESHCKEKLAVDLSVDENCEEIISQSENCENQCPAEILESHCKEKLAVDLSVHENCEEIISQSENCENQCPAEILESHCKEKLAVDLSVDDNCEEIISQSENCENQCPAEILESHCKEKLAVDLSVDENCEEIISQSENCENQCPAEIPESQCKEKLPVDLSVDENCEEIMNISNSENSLRLLDDTSSHSSINVEVTSTSVNKPMTSHESSTDFTEQTSAVVLDELSEDKDKIILDTVSLDTSLNVQSSSDNKCQENKTCKRNESAKYSFLDFIKQDRSLIAGECILCDNSLFNDLCLHASQYHSCVSYIPIYQTDAFIHQMRERMGFEIHPFCDSIYGNPSYICKSCGSLFKSVDTARIHLNSHKEIYMIQSSSLNCSCHKSNFSYSHQKWRSLLLHSKFMCSSCQYIFACQNGLVSHLKVVHFGGNYCQICKLKVDLKSDSSIIEHNRCLSTTCEESVIDSFKEIEEDCDQTYFSWNALDNHLNYLDGKSFRLDALKKLNNQWDRCNLMLPMAVDPSFATIPENMAISPTPEMPFYIKFKLDPKLTGKEIDKYASKVLDMPVQMMLQKKFSVKRRGKSGAHYKKGKTKPTLPFCLDLNCDKNKKRFSAISCQEGESTPPARCKYARKAKTKVQKVESVEETKLKIPEVLEENILRPTRTRSGAKPVENSENEVQEESVDLPVTTRISTNEITGEWVNYHTYVCCACGAVYMDLAEIMDHKWETHPGVWCAHTMIQGQAKVPKLFCEQYLPPHSRSSFGKSTETITSKVSSKQREKHAKENMSCSQCKKKFNSKEEFHAHIIDCGGLSQFISTKKKNKKGFRFKRRKGQGIPSRRYGNTSIASTPQKNYIERGSGLSTPSKEMSQQGITTSSSNVVKRRLELAIGSIENSKLKKKLRAILSKQRTSPPSSKKRNLRRRQLRKKSNHKRTRITRLFEAQTVSKKRSEKTLVENEKEDGSVDLERSVKMKPKSKSEELTDNEKVVVPKKTKKKSKLPNEEVSFKVDPKHKKVLTPELDEKKHNLEKVPQGKTKTKLSGNKTDLRKNQKSEIEITGKSKKSFTLGNIKKKMKESSTKEDLKQKKRKSAISNAERKTNNEEMEREIKRKRQSLSAKSQKEVKQDEKESELKSEKLLGGRSKNKVDSKSDKQIDTKSVKQTQSKSLKQANGNSRKQVKRMFKKHGECKSSEHVEDKIQKQTHEKMQTSVMKKIQKRSKGKFKKHLESKTKKQSEFKSPKTEDEIQKLAEDNVQKPVENKILKRSKGKVKKQREGKTKTQSMSKSKKEVESKMQKREGKTQKQADRKIKKQEGKIQNSAEDKIQNQAEVKILKQEEVKVQIQAEDKIQNQAKDIIQNKAENIIQNQTEDKIQNQVKDKIQKQNTTNFRKQLADKTKKYSRLHKGRKGDQKSRGSSTDSKEKVNIGKPKIKTTISTPDDSLKMTEEPEAKHTLEPLVDVTESIDPKITKQTSLGQQKKKAVTEKQEEPPSNGVITSSGDEDSEVGTKKRKRITPASKRSVFIKKMRKETKKLLRKPRCSAKPFESEADQPDSLVTKETTPTTLKTKMLTPTVPVPLMMEEKREDSDSSSEPEIIRNFRRKRLVGRAGLRTRKAKYTNPYSLRPSVNVTKDDVTSEYSAKLDDVDDEEDEFLTKPRRSSIRRYNIGDDDDDTSDILLPNPPLEDNAALKLLVSASESDKPKQMNEENVFQSSKGPLEQLDQEICDKERSQTVVESPKTKIRMFCFLAQKNLERLKLNRLSQPNTESESSSGFEGFSCLVKRKKKCRLKSESLSNSYETKIELNADLDSAVPPTQVQTTDVQLVNSGENDKTLKNSVIPSRKKRQCKPTKPKKRKICPRIITTSDSESDIPTQDRIGKVEEVSCSEMSTVPNKDTSPQSNKSSASTQFKQVTGPSNTARLRRNKSNRKKLKRKPNKYSFRDHDSVGNDYADVSNCDSTSVQSSEVHPDSIIDVPSVKNKVKSKRKYSFRKKLPNDPPNDILPTKPKAKKILKEVSVLSYKSLNTKESFTVQEAQKDSDKPTDAENDISQELQKPRMKRPYTKRKRNAADENSPTVAKTARKHKLKVPQNSSEKLGEETHIDPDSMGFLCIDCGLSFDSALSREDHRQDCRNIAFEMSLMAEDHLYECPYCQLTFALRGTQRKHISSCRMSRSRKHSSRRKRRSTTTSRTANVSNESPTLFTSTKNCLEPLSTPCEEPRPPAEDSAKEVNDSRLGKPDDEIRMDVMGERLSVYCREMVGMKEICALMSNYKFCTNDLRCLLNTSSIVQDSSTVISFDSANFLPSPVTTMNSNYETLVSLLQRPTCFNLSPEFSSVLMNINKTPTTDSETKEFTVDVGRPELLKALSNVEELLKEVSSFDFFLKKEQMLLTMKHTFQADTGS